MFPFHAGTACAAMLFISFVAAPCIGIWNFQVHSQLDNIVLTEMHKRSFEPQLRMTKPFHSKPLHSDESRNEGRPTIRIDKVITCVDSNGYNVSLLSNGHCISNRQHHRIAVWHNCYRHVRCRIVSVRADPLRNRVTLDKSTTSNAASSRRAQRSANRSSFLCRCP